MCKKNKSGWKVLKNVVHKVHRIIGLMVEVSKFWVFFYLFDQKFTKSASSY